LVSVVALVMGHLGKEIPFKFRLVQASSRMLKRRVIEVTWRWDAESPGGIAEVIPEVRRR
jgi:hypothetical protein